MILYPIFAVNSIVAVLILSFSFTFTITQGIALIFIIYLYQCTIMLFAKPKEYEDSP